ncbi:MAG: D-alanine--D-alanine ligase [bacterium]|nr:D-alanine--D-alanine ligase [bacterium]
MTTKRIKTAILFGGQSAEHDVSLNSTNALFTHLDKERFQPTLIHINRKGSWRIIDEASFLKRDFDDGPGNARHSFLPWLMEAVEKVDADIYFPMLHGPNGEDGKIQAMLEMAGKPYVGASAASSALAMDKVASKVLFQHAGLAVGEFLFFESNDFSHIEEEVRRKLTYPVFVKPSAMGSSVGVRKACDGKQLKEAVDLAFRYDRKILVETALDIREIEVSVMGNRDIMVSRPGELIPHNDFYDYKDKYVDGKTTFHMPADLDEKAEAEIRRIAGAAYKALFLNGMSRVDLFLENKTAKIIVNEINTIPGFTAISMFPKLWQLQGISFTQLISKLIDYGFQYHEEQKISTTVS